MKKDKTKEFIQKAQSIHRDKYDYSKVDYKNSYTKVCIICKTHGEFWQDPHAHLKGYGCRQCSLDKQRTMVCGVGICDCPKEYKSFSVWQGMIRRCYSRKFQEKYKSYQGCLVCNEWLSYSVFKDWFDKNYIDGLDLDKDILVKGNKIYSPETCVFVPHRINALLLSCKEARGNLPIGVSVYSKNKYQVKITSGKKKYHIGYFNTKEDAFMAYKRAKEAYVRQVAQEYYSKSQIPTNVYEALMRWEISETD